MASQPHDNDASDLEAMSNGDLVSEVFEDLNKALDRLDRLGMTDAGALLSRVLDSLTSFVSDLPENGQATQP